MIESMKRRLLSMFLCVLLLVSGQDVLAETTPDETIAVDREGGSAEVASTNEERVVGKALSSLDGRYTPFSEEESDDDTWLDTLDDFHDWFFMNADRYVAGADEMFAETDGPVRRVTNSTFSIELYSEFKHDKEIEFELSPSFSADVYLPNMEHRLNLFIDNVALDELPGADPMKRKDPLQLGASSGFDFWDVIDLDLSVGVKWRWPPIVFTDMGWSKYLETKDKKWHFQPSAKGFWYSDDGFGTKGSLRLELWPSMESLVSMAWGARWTEETEGVEWSASLGTGMLLSGTRSAANHVIGTRLVVAGHKSSASVMDNYRYEVIYRCPLYNEWIFLSVTPKVEWDDDNDWNTVPSIMFGIDMYFDSVLGGE